MATTVRTPNVAGWGIDQRFIAAEGTAYEIDNLFLTEEGTLKTVVGPTPYLAYGINDTAETSYKGFSDYNEVYGIGAAKINGREILLIHCGSEIWEFQGWKRAWRPIVSTTSGLGDPMYKMDLPDENDPRFPTQFVATPNGIVINVPGKRTLFYDGVRIAPLGYDSRPSPPSLVGPTSSESNQSELSALTAPLTEINDLGYAHDAQHFLPSGWHPDFGICRLGTVRTPADTTNIGGILEAAQYEGAVQLIDVWGNLSPISRRSNPVQFQQQIARTYVDSSTEQKAAVADLIRKQILFQGIPTGEDHTAGRLLLRTRDTRNSGTNQLFVLPSDGTSARSLLATIPDNSTRAYPDNISDASLVLTAVDVVPVPRFKVCWVAMGSLWIGNWEGGEGTVRRSLPNQWGSFPVDPQHVFRPDPIGGEITGGSACAEGVLIFTERSTFLLTPYESGEGLRRIQVNGSVGCAAPNSVARLPSGEVIWWSGDAFYVYQAGQAVRISDSILPTLRSVNTVFSVRAAGYYDPETREYVCWLPWQGSTLNNKGFAYDGVNWRTYSYMKHVTGVAKLPGSDSIIIASGRAKGRPTNISGQSEDEYKGVWALHREGGWTPADKTTRYQTEWLGRKYGAVRVSPRHLFTHLRETQTGTVSVSAHKDRQRRAYNAASTYQPAYPGGTASSFSPDEAAEVLLQHPEANSKVWGTSIDVADGTVDFRGEVDGGWTRRAEWYQSSDIPVLNSTTYSISLSTTSRLELVAMTFENSINYNPEALERN